MTCLICGEICRCSPVDSATISRGLADDSACPAPTPETSSQQAGGSAEAVSDDSPPEDSAAWRQEVAARLNRYQARRKPRPPRYPSLRLPFEEKERARPDIVSTGTSFSQNSRHALALNDFEFATEEQGRNVRAHHSPDADLPRETARASHAAESSQANASVAPPPIAPTATAKIIEFPRFWTPAPAPLDELAEPVMDRPRILEAPEVLPPPPALGGIIIEPAPQPETEKRPGIDIPLQSAPLARRIFSAAIDDAIVSAACVLFGYVFFKMTLFRPPRVQIMIFAGGLFGLFWAAYQYLLVVHSGSTPGLRLARLELARFDGLPARRSLRRWRVLASFLSAISLGMGYAWVFLDEDALCWHDRITHTYLAPKARFAETELSPTRG